LLSVYGGGLLYLCIMLILPEKHRAVVQHITCPALSIIIPFKNEATNLARMLTSLQAQTYPGACEVILVNDASDDAFETVLAPFMNSTAPTIRLLHASAHSRANLTSKQQALETGVCAAQYDWLVFTDADMLFEPAWLSSLTQGIPEGYDLIFGHTSIGGVVHGAVKKLQAYQLAFLFAVAYAFRRAHLPASCMGNNILIRKEAYAAVGGQPGLGYSIAEDFKLLEAFRQKGFVIGTPASFMPLAHTFPCLSLQSYYHQMLRWARGGLSLTSLLLPAGILFTVQNSTLTCALIGIVPQYYAVYAVINFLLTILFVAIAFKKTGTAQKAGAFPIYFCAVILETIAFAVSFLVTPSVIWKNRKL
jgi:cellulose synthase/poly-beta-1,6-N-acetylglucosamine synthase-like glycosyltransferase